MFRLFGLLIVGLVLGLFIGSPVSASNLPVCKKDLKVEFWKIVKKIKPKTQIPRPNWDDCHGTIEDDTYKYVGEFKGGRYDGQGVLITFPQVLKKPLLDSKKVDSFSFYKTGTPDIYGYQMPLRWWKTGKYIGEFKRGKPHGQGTLTSGTEDITTYVGQWLRGKPHGQGSYTREFKDEATQSYVGEWFEGKPHGQSTYMYGDEAKYVGQFKHGEWEGQGVLTTSDFDSSGYTPRFSRLSRLCFAYKKATGGCKCPYLNAKYVGEWFGGEPHGQGTWIYADGSEYVGNFYFGSRHGYGTFNFADGGNQLWANEFYPHTTLIREAGRLRELTTGSKSKGGLLDLWDKAVGYTTYPCFPLKESPYANSTYTGYWQNGKFSGQGTHSYSDGQAKDGIWLSGAFMGAKKVPSNGSNAVAASITATATNTLTSAKLTAAQKEAERLRQELAALKAEQELQQQQTISNDTQIPLITITQSGADGRKGTIKGYAKDNVQIAEVLIDGQPVQLGSNGSFEWSGFVPTTGKNIVIEAIDTAALSSTKTVSLKRGQIQQASGPRFDDLDPTSGKRVKRNDNALALIVGIADYERTDAPAIYADKDAQFFHDYASLKLGIPDSNITTMVNDKAEQGDVILAVKDWMRRSSEPGKSDVYVFFAGHGLASENGEEMYLLPYDGRPRLLNETAISRERLFADISAANPRSVTVFLDTCYSGTTRGTDMLITSRPIAIRALEQSIPDNFTVMTAAAGDQTAKPLEEAKHGMFSYFLMKGMEGEADANNDNEITAGELHSYVQTNVIQQSSGSQTPELQGDADRVLVRFQ